jgi:ketosteroid isomerase-like protein
MSESNVERARRGFAAAHSGDLDAVRELLDPDVSWHGGDPSAEGACHNRPQALEFIARARERGPIGELVDVVDAGDRVVVIMRSPSEDGEPGALSANLTTFRDGRAIEMVHYPSPADALTAAGL